MSFQMPTFNLSDPGISKEEFSKPRAQGGFNVEPGNYTLVIKKVDVKGPSRGDATFINIELELETVAGKTLKHWINVPTSKIVYGQKNTTFVFEQLQAFLGSLGIDLTFDNRATVIPQYFSNPEALAGKELNVDVGYEGAYVKYISKGNYSVVLKNGQDLVDANGSIMIFADSKAAQACGEGATGGRVASRTGILKFHKKEVQVDVSGW